MTEPIEVKAILGPRYEVVIQTPTVHVGEGFNLTIETPPPMVIDVGIGYNGVAAKTGTVDVRVTTSEIIGAYKAVGYDGYTTKRTFESLSNYAGLTRVAAVMGETIDVVRSGLIEESAWSWTANAPLFIADNGLLTQEVPVGVIRRIGWALTPHKINLDPYPIIGV